MDTAQNDSFTLISFRDMINIIFRYKYLIVSVFVIACGASYMYVRSQPEIYVSEAKLLLTVGRENIQMIPTGDNAVSVSRSATQDINAEIEILRTPDLYSQLYDDLDMESYLYAHNAIPPEIPLSSPEYAAIRDQVIHNFMDNTRIEIARNANVIVISYGSMDPDLAHQIVSRLIEIYLDKRAGIHYSSGSYNFFSDQSNKYLTALNDIEKQLADIKNELNITSIPDYRSALMTRIESTRNELDMNSASIAEASSQIDLIQSELVNPPVSGSSGNAMNYESIITELTNLQVQERELLSKYTEDNIQVRNVRRRIDELSARLQNTMTDDGSSASSLEMQQNLSTRKIELAGLKAKNNELQKTLTQSLDDLKKLNDAELTINQLERNREIQYENYMKYSDNLEESRIDQIVQQEKLSNIRILQEATLPTMPIAQRKYRNLAMGMFLGLFGGMGMAFILDYMDNTVKTPEDIEKRLKLQTLTSIPFSSGRKDMDTVTHLLLTDRRNVG